MARVIPAPRMIPKPSEEKGSLPNAIKMMLTNTNNPTVPIRIKSLCPYAFRTPDLLEMKNTTLPNITKMMIMT